MSGRAAQKESRARANTDGGQDRQKNDRYPREQTLCGIPVFAFCARPQRRFGAESGKKKRPESPGVLCVGRRQVLVGDGAVFLLEGGHVLADQPGHFRFTSRQSITVGVRPMPTTAEVILRQLLHPQMPSAVRPTARWKALSAFSVFAPKMPSSVRVE